jgi:hypothetical protein
LTPERTGRELCAVPNYPEENMVAWSQLAVPILLSVVLVFLVSSLIHAALQLHQKQYRKLDNEDEVRAAIRKSAPAPGMYILPYCKHGKDAAAPEMIKKFEEGPLGVLYVRPSGMIKIGPFLAQWVVYTFAVSCVVAYLARVVLDPHATFLGAFRVVGTTAWLAYAWQSPSDAIWKSKPWSVAFGEMFDGLVYALLTAAVFAWFWPR